MLSAPTIKKSENLPCVDQQTSKKLRADIQALRAVAVLAVVIYHFWPNVLPGGFIGVDIFFVLSGFLVGGFLIRAGSRGEPINLLGFYARRIKRILPSAYITIALTMVFLWVLVPINRWENASREAIASIIYLQNLLLAQNSVDYLAQDAPDSLFRHFWSLSVEEQFYIVIPLLVLLCAVVAKRAGWSPKIIVGGSVALLVCASFIYSHIQVSAGNPAAYFTLTSRLWELGVGALLVFLPANILRGRVRFGALLLGWGAIVWALFFTDPAAFPGMGALPPVLGTALLLYLGFGATEGIGKRITTAWPVQYVGDISYNLYLTHWPIIVLLPLMFENVGLAEKSGAVVVSLLLAMVLFHAVDKPLRDVRVNKNNTKKILVWGFIGSLLIAIVSFLPGILSHAQESQQKNEINSILEHEFNNLGLTEKTKIELPEIALETTRLLPNPAHVRDSLPTGAEGRCKSNMADPFTPTCMFGAEDAPTRIALAGDSHSEQYLPAFEKIVAANPDVRVDTYFHSSCPLSTAQRMSDADRGGPCVVANNATLKTLIDEKYDVVVTSNRTAVEWVAPPEKPSPEEGFSDVWSQLAAHSIPVVVLSDNPMMLPAEGTTECLVKNPTEPQTCARARSEALPRDHQISPAKTTEGVTLVDTSSWFCTTDLCPAVIGNVVVYRDEQHISVLYAETLADEVWAAVTRR